MKMKSKERLDDILIAEEGNSSDPTQTSKTQQKADDTIESSSTGSDGGKGAGSGGGYSADYSSSDTSSDDVREGTVPETEMKRLTVSTEKKEVKAKGVKREKKMPHGKRHDSTVDLSQVSPEDLSESKAAPEGTELVLSKDGILPQWNGVRIHHPMDPRIDLSTVGHIQTSSLSAFPSDLIHAPMVDCKDDRIFSDFASNSATPSIDQYMSLLEVN